MDFQMQPGVTYTVGSQLSNIAMPYSSFPEPPVITVLPDGVVDGEDTGEVMGVGYDDSGQANDGGGDIIDGSDGLDDSIRGNGGDDSISGGADADSITGGVGNDVIYGDAVGSSTDASREVVDSDTGSETDMASGYNAGQTGNVTDGSGNDVGWEVTDRIGYTGNGSYNGIDGGSWMQGVTGDSISLEFDQPLAGLVMNASGNSVGTGNLLEYTINGQVVDLNTLIADGEAVLSGSAAVSGDGRLEIGVNQLGGVKFLTEIDTITVENASAGGNASDYALIDFSVDTGVSVVETPGTADAPVEAVDDGDDTIEGGAGEDTIYGGGGDDSIDGGEDDDTIYGGSGNDTIQSGDELAGTVTTPAQPGTFTTLTGLNTTSGSFVNDGGQTITYNTVSSETIDSYSPGYGGLSDYWIGNQDGGIDANEAHTHSFSEQVAGTQIQFNATNDTETFSFRLDGQDLDLSQAIADGTVIFDGASTYGLDASGKITLVGSVGPTIGEVDIRIPFTTLEVVHEGPSGGGSIYDLDIYTDLPPAGGETTETYNGGDFIDAGEGDDVIDGGAGEDTVWGGAGDDTIDGGTDDDLLYGDAPGYLVGQAFQQGVDFTFTSGHVENQPGFNSSALNVSGSGQTIRFVDDDVNLDGDSSTGEVSDDATQQVEIDGVLYDAFVDFDVQYTDGSETYTFAVIDVDLDGDGIADAAGGSEDGTFLIQIGGPPLIGGEALTAISGSLSTTDPTPYADLPTVGGEDVIDGGEGADTIFGGIGDDTITAGAGDDIDGGDDADTFIIDGANSEDGDVVTIDGGTDGTDLDSFQLGSGLSVISNIFTDDLDGDSQSGTIVFQDAEGDQFTVNFSEIEVVCFTNGTRITTETGDLLVENLEIWIRVETLDNGLQPIRWIGKKVLNTDDLERKPKLLPIKIKAGALGGGLPLQDLSVSRQHRMMVRSKIVQSMFGEDEVLVPAIALTDLEGIEEDRTLKEVIYFHILFDRHEVIYADGAPSESLHTGPQALKSVSQEGREEIFTLFPELRYTANSRDLDRTVPTSKRRGQLIQRHVKNKRNLLDVG